MNCNQVQSLLVSYLNNEITPSERALMQRHLSDCMACWQELSRMFDMQEKLTLALQRQAAQVMPSAEAWEKLESRLAQAAQPSPIQSGTWLSRLAQGVSRISQHISGDITMRKQVLVAVCAAVLLVSVIAISLFNNTTSVSAHDVLDKAYAAQASAANAAEGIHHLRMENYSNFQALPEDQGMSTTLESFADLQTGIYRNIIIDNKTGRVIDISAYDGTYTYSRDWSEEVAEGELVTIYRTPQGRVAGLKPAGSGDRVDEHALFEQMRSDPNVQYIGRKTWQDGRKVHVLQSYQPAKVLIADAVQRPMALVSMYFDVETYKQIGYRMTIERAGRQILLAEQKVLVDEILPAGSLTWSVAFSNVRIVDDPERTHGDLLPEVITREELAVKMQFAYLLKAVPSGYSLEISAPPVQPANEPYFYIASYRSADNDYFVIQSLALGEAEKLLQQNSETYTTAGGLVIHIINDSAGPSGRHSLSAVVEAPDGALFMVSSTLPLEMLKEWSEELELVK